MRCLAKGILMARSDPRPDRQRREVLLGRHCMTFDQLTPSLVVVVVCQHGKRLATLRMLERLRQGRVQHLTSWYAEELKLEMLAGDTRWDSRSAASPRASRPTLLQPACGHTSMRLHVPSAVRPFTSWPSVCPGHHTLGQTLKPAHQKNSAQC
jgi:hypothetical protein